MAPELTGRTLAESAQLHLRRLDPSQSGVAIEDLVRHLERSGIRIKGDDPWTTLRSALNGAQDLFTNRDGLWCWMEQTRAVGTELSGRALSDAILVHVHGAYSRDRVFHYEVAKEQMLAKGVRIRGPVTGRTMRSALVGSPDRFEPVGRGTWRWKAPSVGRSDVSAQSSEVSPK